MELLPNDIKRYIYKEYVKKYRFEKHQEIFKVVHDEMKKDEFHKITRINLDVEDKFNLKKLGLFGVKSWAEINELLYYYNNTSSIIEIQGRKYNLIGYDDDGVYCDHCKKHDDAIVCHKTKKLVCKKCNMK
jgi:hypothetical protein